jgi:TetR/AcrR family transcriptional regulator, regulator of cefoperazone and chloramphenicol sensitivity
MNEDLPVPVTRGDSTRGALIKAAIDVFGRDGFNAASTRTIAEAAGVNQALIGYHFGGKPRLYLAALEHIGDSVWQRVGPLVDAIDQELAAAKGEAGGVPIPNERALELLYGITDAMVAMLCDDESAAWARLILREQQDPSEGFDLFYQRIMSRVFRAVTGLIGAARGSDSNAYDTKLTATTILGQALVFRAARAAVMRHMKWQNMGREHIRRIQKQIRCNVGAIVREESSE